MKPLRIALDMDSVLANISVVTNKVMSELEGKPVDVTSVPWLFLKHLGLEAKYKYPDIFQEVWKRWAQIPPCEAEVGRLTWALNKIGIVDIVTAAGGYESEKERKEWLAKNKISCNQMVVVPMHSSKLDLDYDIWVDDNPNDVRAAILRHKQLFVYDQPWNRDIPTPTMTVTRIRTLKTAIIVLKGKGGFRGVKPARQLLQ
jgi:5'(3')-deoxyribonucleotidase